jgi:hypothetical protein
MTSEPSEMKSAVWRIEEDQERRRKAVELHSTKSGEPLRKAGFPSNPVFVATDGSFIENENGTKEVCDAVTLFAQPISGEDAAGDIKKQRANTATVSRRAVARVFQFGAFGCVRHFKTVLHNRVWDSAFLVLRKMERFWLVASEADVAREPTSSLPGFPTLRPADLVLRLSVGALSPVITNLLVDVMPQGLLVPTAYVDSPELHTLLSGLREPEMLRVLPKEAAAPLFLRAQ